ncbi:MAG TPA: peptidoglycan-binding domain-containing protein [Candidatus Lumbricidophila sp.]|nr:peptidoglycan-binding domain-containing protein [Candidatus Lumbricidophila sp.]
MSIKSRIGWTALAVVVVAGVGLTAAATAGFGFAPAAVHVKPKVETAKVAKKDLTDTVEANGSVGYEAQQSLTMAGGTVTWLPKEGDDIQRGGTLYKVDEKPKVLLYGGLPLWRPLSVGTTGDDVKQFEENLAALGYTGFDVDTKFTSATEAAVKKWQKALGLDQSGVVDQSWVYYSSGAVRVNAVTASVGASSGEVIQVANNSRVIAVKLKPDAARFATVGAKVNYVSADGPSGTGTVSAVKTTISRDQSSGNDTTMLQVTVRPDDVTTLGALGESTAKVTFVTDTRPGVLTVPVTALLALNEGGYAVQIVDPKAATGSRLVAVKTGLFSQGQVEVSGTDLAEGQDVVVAS